MAPPTTPRTTAEPAGTTRARAPPITPTTPSAVVDHGSTYDPPYDGAAAEHYEGTVTVDHATFDQKSIARCTYTLQWPGIEIAVDATMTVAITADALDVSIDLD